MRYLIAMTVAIAMALAATIFVSPEVAKWAIANARFESPDQVSNYEDMAFFVTSLAGLFVGWIVGWIVGGFLVTDETKDLD